MSSDNPFMNRGPSQAPSAAVSGGSGQGAPRPGTVSGAPSAGRSSRQLSLLPTVMAVVLIVISMGLAVIVLRGMNSDLTANVVLSSWAYWYWLPLYPPLLSSGTSRPTWVR